MVKKILIGALTLVMSISMASCGNSSTKTEMNTSGESEENTNMVSEATEKASSPTENQMTEVSLWTWSPITRTANKMISAFESSNPGIKINYTNYNYNPEYLGALAAASASNNLPDIIGIQPGSLTQTYSNYLIDLGQYAAKEWGDDWTSKYDNVTKSQLQLGNKQGDNSYYILPIETQDIYIEYNKALFAKLGLKVPQTYDELVNCASVLRKGGYAPLFFGGADGWQHVNLLIMCATQIDKNLFDDCQYGKKPWTSDEMKRAMKNFKKLFDDGVIQDGSLSSTSYSDGTTLFLAGKAGMMALGS